MRMDTAGVLELSKARGREPRGQVSMARGGVRKNGGTVLQLNECSSHDRTKKRQQRTQTAY